MTRHVSHRRKNQNNTIIIAIIMVLCAALITFLVLSFIAPKNAKKEEEKTTTTSTTTTTSKTSSTDSKVSVTTTSVEEPKKVVQNEGEDPNIEPGFTGFFTRSDVSGNKLTLRLTINQIIGAQGTCKLLMTNDNGGQIEQVAQTVSNPSSSSCQGFDVPLDGVAKGNWNVRVTVEADGKTGILETVVKI
jgi:hypothetical protein